MSKIYTAIESVINAHNNHFNKVSFSKWLSENRKKLLTQELEIAELYAEFCVMCDREGKPLIKFKDYIKLINQNKDEDKKR